MKQFIVASLFVTTLAFSASAETIKLKSGKAIEGTVVERNDQFIKIDRGIGVNLTYYLDEIDSVGSVAGVSPTVEGKIIRYSRSGNFGVITVRTADGSEVETNVNEKTVFEGITFKEIKVFDMVVISYSTSENKNQAKHIRITPEAEIKSSLPEPVPMVHFGEGDVAEVQHKIYQSCMAASKNKNSKVQAMCICQAKKWASGIIKSPTDPTQTLKIKKEYVDNLIANWNYDIGIKDGARLDGENAEMAVIAMNIGFTCAEELGELQVRK